MRNRLVIALLGAASCVFLMMSCGGGGGGGVATPPCSNCISVDTPAVAFGDVALNDYREKTVLIQNTGAGSLILSGIAVGNPLAPPFQIPIESDGCSNHTLAPTQSCTMKLRFSPTALGSGLTDSFDIQSNDPNTVTVSVSGNGIAAAPPPIPPTATINVSSTEISFGDVTWNLSRSQTITVKNDGSLNLVVNDIAHPLTAPFSISSNNCSGSTVGPKGTCTLAVLFSPTNQADVSDFFYIPSNDPHQPSVTVSVSGSGKAPAAPTPPSATINVTPNNLDFANVVLGNSAEQTILVQNNALVGSNDLVVGQIADTLAAPFSISSDDCSGRHLAPAATCPVAVKFSPTTQGSNLSGFFDIPSNAQNNKSVRVPVKGNGRGLRVSINDVKTDSCPANISLLVSVSNSVGNPIPGLGQDNMSVSENGVLLGLAGFSAVSSPIPVSVALVQDFSGSMVNVLPDVKTAAKGFIDQLVPGDEGTVIDFSNIVQLIQSFTDNADALKSAIDIGIPEGNFTVVYDALWSAIDNTIAGAKAGNNRSIILVSDGADTNADFTGNGSVKTLDEVVAHAQANHITIFTIGLGQVDTNVMTRLADDTGGQYFEAPDSTQLGVIYTAIRKAISGDYTLSYIPSAAPGGFVLVDVFVNSNGLQGETSKIIAGCP